MARKPKNRRERQAARASAHQQITEMPLVEYTRDAMKIFGSYTLEQRAVIDYRDGLKPVQRRVLYSTYELKLMGERGVVAKAAKIVGDSMGNYHPHGDSSIYGAMVSMTDTSVPTVYGSGNWGTLLDGPAAMRYTEASLTRYSDRAFFDYADVMDTVLNYDGSRREPLILPASVPNLLLNGSFGIATGTTIGIPAFQVEGVIKLAKEAVAGREITVKACMKNLVPTCAEGGYALMEDDEEYKYTEELRRFFETGQGSLYWMPEAEINIAQRQMVVSGFAPGIAISLQTSLNKLAGMEDIDFHDESDIDPENPENTKMVYRIVVRKSVPKDEVEDVLYEAQSAFEGTQRLNFAVNTRNRNELDESEVEFDPINMPDFFKRWAEYRISLEREQIDYLTGVVQRKLDRDELLLFAVLNREVIIRALDRKDTEDYLVRQLKKPIEYINQILDLRVRQLKALEEAPIRARIREHKAEIKQLQADHRDPVKRIHTAMDHTVEAI